MAQGQRRANGFLRGIERLPRASDFDRVRNLSGNSEQSCGSPSRFGKRTTLGPGFTSDGSTPLLCKIEGHTRPAMQDARPASLAYEAVHAGRQDKAERQLPLRARSSTGRAGGALSYDCGLAAHKNLRAAPKRPALDLADTRYGTAWCRRGVSSQTQCLHQRILASETPHPTANEPRGH